jgi:hypothetical protein
MEILVQAEKKGINLCDLLSHLMTLAKFGGKVVEFTDADKLPISPTNMPSDGSFPARLRVTTIQTNKLKKVTLGFFMKSTAKFSEIKNSIGLGWLRRFHIFLRLQHLPFEYGTDLFLMGYLTQEHPNFACVETLEQTMKMNWFDSDDRESIEQSGNNDLIQMLAEMNKEKIIVNDKV